MLPVFRLNAPFCTNNTPLLLLQNVGFNANVTIEELGTPDKIIAGFAPELFGHPLTSDEDVLETTTASKDGLTYYYWCAPDILLLG